MALWTCQPFLGSTISTKPESASFKKERNFSLSTGINPEALVVLEMLDNPRGIPTQFCNKTSIGLTLKNCRSEEGNSIFFFSQCS